MFSRFTTRDPMEGYFVVAVPHPIRVRLRRHNETIEEALTLAYRDFRSDDRRQESADAHRLLNMFEHLLFGAGAVPHSRMLVLDRTYYGLLSREGCIESATIKTHVTLTPEPTFVGSMRGFDVWAADSSVIRMAFELPDVEGLLTLELPVD